MITRMRRAANDLAMGLARRLVGSRRTHRFAWAQWLLARFRAGTTLRPVFRRLNVQWDVPGHAMLVGSEIAGPGPDEVMVRTIASAVSPGTERAAFLVEANTNVSFPVLPGYSLAGKVWKVGRRVGRFQRGDLVVTSAPHASLVVRPQELVFPLPPSVSSRDGAFLFLGIICLHGIWRGQLEEGESVAVLGRGIIGQLTTQIAKALGASKVLSIAPSRRHVTPELGRFADRVIVTSELEGSALDTGGVDLTIEASGAPEALHDALNVTRPGGRVVLLGSYRKPMSNFDPGIVADHRISLIGAHISTLGATETSAEHAYRRAAETFLGLLAERRIDPGTLAGTEINPWEVGRLYRDIARGRMRSPTALLRWDRLADRERAGRATFLPPDVELVRGLSMKRRPLPERAGRLA